MLIWVISNNRSGTLNPAMQLAQAVGNRVSAANGEKVVIEHKNPRRTIWHNLPVGLWPAAALEPSYYGAGFASGLPRLCISNGHSALAAAVAVKAAAGDGVYSMHLQTAAMVGGRFDLVVVPSHDGPGAGDNEWPMLGSFEDFSISPPVVSDFLPDLPRPVVAILLGGNNRHYSLDGDTAAALSSRLAVAIGSAGGSYLLSASRRTPMDSFAVFCDGLRHLPGQSWSAGAGNTANPYREYLAKADIFAVSCDSVNMLTEACAMAKPVYMLPLKRRFSLLPDKFRHFRLDLQNASLARDFTGSLDGWDSPGLKESSRLLEKVLVSL